MKRQQPDESTTLAIAQALENNKSIKQVAHNFGISYNSVWRISWLVKCNQLEKKNETDYSSNSIGSVINGSVSSM
jgi:molybdenum-dependent DNA-binding transcriptional regulator ModE